MTLKKKAAAVVVVRRWPARVLFKNKINILVRLSFSGFDRLRRKIIEIAKFRYYARRVLKLVRALGDLDEGEFFQDRCVGMTDALVREDGLIIIFSIFIIIIDSLAGIISSFRCYILHHT